MLKMLFLHELADAKELFELIADEKRILPIYSRKRLLDYALLMGYATTRTQV